MNFELRDFRTDSNLHLRDFRLDSDLFFRDLQLTGLKLDLRVAAQTRETGFGVVAQRLEA